MEIPKGYITVSEAAEITGLDENTIYGYINSGKLSALKYPLGRRKFVVREKEVYELTQPIPYVPDREK